MNLADISKLSEIEARAYFERIRWPNGPVCPHCGSVDVSALHGKVHRVGLYKCKACEDQFTATVNTILEDTHLPIRIWMMAFSILCSSKKGVSALQLQRQLGLGSYRTAWHLCHRIRHAMGKEPMAGLLRGRVVADETYVGGKPRKYSGKPVVMGRGTRKIPVLALVEEGGRVRAGSVPNVTGRTLKTAIRENVHGRSTIITDDYKAYRGIGRGFTGGHQVVSHSKGEYSKNGFSTNEAEAFFALLKRGVVGSFHHVSKQHLDKYCDEFSFRWNWRYVSDDQRTEEAIKSGEGCRLMYKMPIAKN